MINPEHWQQIQSVYHLALPLNTAERAALLARVCSDDPALREEVESLLAAHDSSDDFMQRSVFQIGLGLLADAEEPAVFIESANDQGALAGLIGQRLDGRYLIESKLDSGGIGDVYLARDKPELLSRRVVVKVLQEKALRNEWIVTKFQQEIEALTRIDDPGVVGIHDAGSLPEGNLYLVMQFVEGDNLRAQIRPDRGMELNDVAHIMQQVGRTLSAAHDRDIIHRDLKPENIMVRRRADGKWQVKVIDFGIAKVRHSVIAPSTVTGKVAGTANYMSPEQLQAKTITAASDVYALGVIAYEMVTGRRPFNPETAYQLSDLQKAGVAVLPRSLRPALSVAAQEVILSALSYRPLDRYQSATAFGDDLAKALLAHEDGLSTWEEPGGLAPTAPSDLGGRDDTRRSLALTTGSTLKLVRSRAIWPLVAVAVLLLAVVGFVGVRYWIARNSLATPPASMSIKLMPERKLTFWLTVQRMYQGQKIGSPFEDAGKTYFQTGDSFRLNFLPDQSGALYLFNEGVNENGAVEWTLLFPTEKSNKWQARIGAKQPLMTGNYFFQGSSGVEKFWLVWAIRPIDLLEAIVSIARVSNGVIGSPNGLSQLREFISQNQAPPTELDQDRTVDRSVFSGRGEITVCRFELKHKPNKVDEPTTLGRSNLRR